MNYKESKSFKVAIIGITGALYIVLGFIFQPISFFGLQFRIAEIITGMCLLFPIPGLIGNLIGVFFVNLTSPLGPIDLIAVLVNIPALFCIIALRKNKSLRYVGGILYAIIISLYVAIILNVVIGLPILLSFIQVFIAESILASIGIFIFGYVGSQIPT